jgi:hypothetical protein
LDVPVKIQEKSSSPEDAYSALDTKGKLVFWGFSYGVSSDSWASIY